jgi:capsule polysaccharide export protein KpsE/RkpR
MSATAVTEPTPNAAPPLTTSTSGQRLLARALIAEADLARALACQAKNPAQRLGSVLERSSAVSDDNLLAALAALTAIPRKGIDAMHQLRSLVVVEPPSLPESVEYPLRTYT